MCTTYTDEPGIKKAIRCPRAIIFFGWTNHVKCITVTHMSRKKKLTAKILVGPGEGVPAIVHTVTQEIFRYTSMAVLTKIVIPFWTLKRFCNERKNDDLVINTTSIVRCLGTTNIFGILYIVA